jgi:hypothetical protein
MRGWKYMRMPLPTPCDLPLELWVLFHIVGLSWKRAGSFGLAARCDLSNTGDRQIPTLRSGRIDWRPCGGVAREGVTLIGRWTISFAVAGFGWPRSRPPTHAGHGRWCICTRGLPSKMRSGDSHRSCFAAIRRPVERAVGSSPRRKRMKLYYLPGASSLFPHIVLVEAGLAFDAVKVDEHTKTIDSGGDYRSINPLGYVPALQLEDGTVLTETVAIAQYVCDRVPTRTSRRPMAHSTSKAPIVAELHLLRAAARLLLSAVRSGDP